MHTYQLASWSRRVIGDGVSLVCQSEMKWDERRWNETEKDGCEESCRRKKRREGNLGESEVYIGEQAALLSRVVGQLWYNREKCRIGQIHRTTGEYQIYSAKWNAIEGIKCLILMQNTWIRQESGRVEFFRAICPGTHKCWRVPMKLL